MQRLVLFDIDQTLVRIGGGNRPQRQVLGISLEQVYGISNAFQDVAFTEGTDLGQGFRGCAGIDGPCSHGRR